MGWWDCDGRECRLAWGYNQSLDLLIPVQRQPLNVTSEPVNRWWYEVWDFSSDNFLSWASFLFIHSIQYEYFRYVLVSIWNRAAKDNSIFKLFLITLNIGKFTESFLDE